VRPAEGGQSDARDDDATGTRAVREVLEAHLRPEDRTGARPRRRGPR